MTEVRASFAAPRFGVLLVTLHITVMLHVAIPTRMIAAERFA